MSKVKHRQNNKMKLKLGRINLDLKTDSVVRAMVSLFSAFFLVVSYMSVSDLFLVHLPYRLF